MIARATATSIENYIQSALRPPENTKHKTREARKDGGSEMQTLPKAGRCSFFQPNGKCRGGNAMVHAKLALGYPLFRVIMKF